MTPASALRVKCVPELSLCVAVAAERPRYPTDAAFSGAGTGDNGGQAWAVGEWERQLQEHRSPPARRMGRLLRRDGELMERAQDVILAVAGDGTPVPAAPAKCCVAGAFGGG